MLSSGFYNSKGGDRKYDAEQFGAMFNGLITDGVFAHYKDALKVTAGSGNRELVVKPGRAWFNGTWTEVDDDGHSIYLMSSAVETTYFVYLAVNKLDRRNTVAWYSNIANNDPEKGLYFYLLAQVTVPGGATKISESMITDTRGSDLCPYVTGIMETVSFEEIVKRVCGDSWQDWLSVYEAGITTGVQNAVATSERALDEVKSLKAYAVESEAVSYIWAKFEAVATGGGGFEWATDSVHTELSDPPMPVCLFRDLSYADLGPGFKPNISLNSPYIADGETSVKAIPAVTQSKVWREYPYFWEGGASFGTEVLRYDDLQRVVVNVGGTATEKYTYRVSRLMHIPVAYEPGEYIGTVSADNATAYPRDGYKDGYYYMRFAAKAQDVSFYYPGLSAKNVRDAIIEVLNTGGNGPGTAMSVIEVEELPSTGTRGVFYIVKKPGDSDASEYLWLDRWEKVGGTDSEQNAVLYTPQELTSEQQEQARKNIGVNDGGSGGGSVEGAVLYTAQNLTEEQREQARKNIGAMSEGTVASLSRKQVNALDALFRVAFYTKKDVSSVYAAFCDAFGIVPPVVYQNEIKKGSCLFTAPSSINVDATRATRATLIPIRYLTKGKTYKFSLGSVASSYLYGVNILLAREAGLKFDYVDGRSTVYDGIVSIEEDSGWTRFDLEYAISKENCVLSVGFRNNDSTALTEADYELIQNNFVLLEEEIETPERAFTIILHRTVGKLSNDSASISMNEALGRMMICASVANSRRFCYYDGRYWTDNSPYSPVPIPNGAVSAVYSIPNGMRFGMAFLGESADNEKSVKYLKDTGWLTASTGTIDVTSYNDGNHYWSANLGYTDDREIPADFDEEAIDVYFVDTDGNRLP